MDRALKNPAVDSAVQLTQTLFTVIRRIIILCTLMYERLRSLRVFTKCTSVTSFQFLSQIGLFNSLKDILLKKLIFIIFHKSPSNVTVSDVRTPKRPVGW